MLKRLFIATLLTFLSFPVLAQSQQFGRGPVYKLYDIPTVGWSWFNQGTATLLKEDKDQAAIRGTGGTGRNVRLRIRGLPATPYTVTAALSFQVLSPNQTNLVFLGAQFALVEPATNKLAGSGLIQPLNVQSRYIHWIKETQGGGTSTGSIVAQRWWSHPVWFRVSDTGTTRTLSVSADGEHFETILSEPSTTYLTATHVGWGLFSESGTVNDVAIVRLLSWQVTQ
jgi:hypothetical protein